MAKWFVIVVLALAVSGGKASAQAESFDGGPVDGVVAGK
jgi:hypothetical protein